MCTNCLKRDIRKKICETTTLSDKNCYSSLSLASTEKKIVILISDLDLLMNT